MPNSRIETGGITQEQLESIGGWTTDGNELFAGGGNLLGSTDNFNWYYITNNIRRGGWSTTGERLLIPDINEGDSWFREIPKRKQTFDDFTDYIFRFFMPDNTLYKFSININFVDETKTNWGNFERKITVLRENGNMHLSRVTFPYTETTNKAIEGYWTNFGNEVRFNIKGLALNTITWTAYVNYFGVKSI